MMLEIVKSIIIIAQSTNPILRLYYTSRPFLFFMCAGNEAFFSFAYLCYFTHGPRLPLIGRHSEFDQSACSKFAFVVCRNRAVQVAALGVVADCTGEDCYLTGAPSTGSAAHCRGGHPHTTGRAEMNEPNNSVPPSITHDSTLAPVSNESTIPNGISPAL